MGNGRLLLFSPFGDRDKRVTTELATKRNRFVASISDEVLIPYASPDNKTEALALDLLASGKQLYTFNERAGMLLDQGAKLVKPEFFLSNWQQRRVLPESLHSVE